MAPTLYHLFHKLFGVEWSGLKFVNSFGFFVAIAFLTASHFFTREMKRKEADGLLKSTKKKTIVGEKASPIELAISGIIGFVLGFKLLYVFVNYEEVVASPPEFILSTKGNIIGGLVLGGVFAYMKYREKEKKRLPEPKTMEVEVHPYEHVGNMTLVAAVFGILGAKIFAILEDPSSFTSLFDNFFSGLTMYGGLIVGGGAVIYYMHRNKLNILPSMDACAPALILAYGVGRIGCQIAGDGDWGIENLNPQPEWMAFLPEWFWAYDYPNNVNGAGGMVIENCAYSSDYCYKLANPVYPTPLYEVIMSFIIFGILWVIRKRLQVAGMLFSIYLIFNGIERFFIEKIRVNETYEGLGGLTQAEIISMLLVLLGTGGLIWLWKRKKSTA